MPSDQLHADQTQGEVLSRVAEFPGLAGKFAPVGKVRDLYRRVQRSPEGFRLETLLAEMRIGLSVGAADQARIPATGPVVVVANHPYGVLDGAILTVLLTRVASRREDTDQFLLADVPELQKHCIFVDPFQTDRSLESNRRGHARGLRLVAEKAACSRYFRRVRSRTGRCRRRKLLIRSGMTQRCG